MKKSTRTRSHSGSVAAAAKSAASKTRIEDDPRFPLLTQVGKELVKFSGLPANMIELLLSCRSFDILETSNEIYDVVTAPGKSYQVRMDVNGMTVVEAEVTESATGIATNFFDDWIRKRDPNSMTIADHPGQKRKTDKPRFNKRFGYDFATLEAETYDELSKTDLLVVPFKAGGRFPAFLVIERNWACLAWMLNKLQQVCSVEELKSLGECRGVVYICPKFRHTKFKRAQVVVHRDNGKVHEIFGYHPYPGPVLKKGVYTMLLAICENMREVVYHASAVLCTSTNGNRTVQMHGGPSGGGKSEHVQNFRRRPDGSLVLAANLITRDEIVETIGITARLQSIADDMIFGSVINNALRISDAEFGWFLRVDNILKYGDEADLEKLCSHPKSPLAFLNIATVPGGVTQLWNHFVDLMGRRSVNPRASQWRSEIPGIVNDPQDVDFMSFGMRAPPTFNTDFLARYNEILRQTGKPEIGMGYGHIGMIHMLSPALAWLWSVVAPRGFDNPSIANAGDGLTTEGVGTFGPFNSGEEVVQANLIWQHFEACPHMRFPLYPVKHVGAWFVGNVPQQLGRELLSRMGHNKFEKDIQICPAQDPLLGYRIRELVLDNLSVPRHMLNTEHQQELGEDGYKAASGMLTTFFKTRAGELNRKRRNLGKGPRRVLEICLDGGSVSDYDGVLHPGNEYVH